MMSLYGCSGSASSVATWLLITYWGLGDRWGGSQRGHKDLIFSIGIVSTSDVRKTLGPYYFILLWFVLRIVSFCSSHWLASLADGMPTCQLFLHTFNHDGFAYTFISAPQEFPSSFTFSVTLKIFPQTSSLGSKLLSAVAATLSSLPPFPPASLSLLPIHFLPLTLPPLKKPQSPLPPFAAPPPSQFTGGARRDQI